MKIPSNVTALLLDMNGTFMFGHDQFGEGQDYHKAYQGLGGSMDASDVNRIVDSIFNYYALIYGNSKYSDCFPKMGEVFEHLMLEEEVSPEDEKLLIKTFALHERGEVSLEYADALRELASRYTLALVSDIWAPKDVWLEEFERAGISDVFKAKSFSSDIGIVKPSPIPFREVLSDLETNEEQAIVIGDSVKHDLEGAKAAGIRCILVGGATHADAHGSYDSLLDLVK